MTRTKKWFRRCATLMFLVAIAVFGGQVRLARAQDISKSVQYGGMETTSAVANSTNSSEIDTYASAVITDYTLWYYGYWAAVEADLYDNLTWIDYNVDDSGLTSAKTQLSDPINLGHQYDAVATSALCWWEDDGDFGYEEDCSAVYSLDLYGILGKPQISSISPSGGTIGKSGSITVQGQNLVDPFSGNASATITGSGVTLSVQSSPSDSQVGLNFSIAQNATVGNQTLTLSNRFGVSNGETFAVGYPPAVVTNVSPSAWTAGQSTSVTITGTGFGNQPTISVNGTGVSLMLNSASPDGTTIQATATVNAAAPSQSITVTVQPGYAGQGFMCNCPSDQANGTDTATIQPVTPAPQIMFNGQNISATTQSVVAGQQIALTVATPSPYSIQPGSVFWSFSNQSAITGGFVNGAGTPGTQPSASAGGSEAADPALNQNSLTFYWVNPGDNGENVTCTYTLNNGQSASATTTFNINGPTGDLLNAWMASNNQALQISDDSGTPEMRLTGSSYPGYNNGNLGVVFTANSGNQPSSGAFVWVQLINSDQEKEVTSSGSYDCPGTPESGLDNTYPYNSGVSNVSDSPFDDTISGKGEVQRSFRATMYLMWNSQLPSSIPIPLESVSWSFSGCAINTLSPQSNGTTWNLFCGLAAPSIPQPSGYPEWTQSATNGQQIICSPHEY